jgi:hypothetical protein
MKVFFKVVLLICVLLATTSQAQTGKSFSWDNDSKKDDVVMTWNKSTPEQEMKDDIKALAQRGITIKYKDVKRNAKNEITAISVTFEDRKGNKGSLNYDNQKPISTITFFKQGDEIGFGEPSNSYNNNFMNGFGGNGFNGFNGNGFNFNNDESNPNQQFEFSFPDMQSFGNGKSRMIIKQGDKKPLVIEDGKVIEGGDDYTQEELDEIIKSNKIEQYDGLDFSNVKPFGQEKEFSQQLQKMQQQIDELMQNRNQQAAPKNEELEQSKEELEKAKEELKKAKKELEQTKSSLNVKKI